MKFRPLMLKTITALLLTACMPMSSLAADAAGSSPAPALQRTAQTNTVTTQGDVSDCLPYSNPVDPPGDDTVSVDTYSTDSSLAAPSMKKGTAPPHMPTNISSESAIEVKPNTPVEGYLPPDMPGCFFWPGGVWYKVKVDKPQKITGLLLTPPSLNYNLYIYYERSGPADVNAVAVSYRNKGPYQLVSHVVEPGTYYFFITANKTDGSFTLPFNFKVILTDTYDNYEKYWDDGPTTEAYLADHSNPMMHTIDNPFDEDWDSLTFDVEGTFTINLNNPSKKSVYKLEVLDMAENVIETVYQNTTKTFRLPLDNYHTRVFAPNPSKYDPTVPYSLSVNFKPDPQPVCGWDDDKPWKWVCTWP
ncbi:hypothetical protein [Paenibacillus shenyangensis]|uniref:hypothetical protein n=1 Tax=Paenibacillus sp. A9 TaxID=1284352 RepID=UPI00036712CB|nr:hypothetical protein [Paenibacillus sp. A9]